MKGRVGLHSTCSLSTTWSCCVPIVLCSLLDYIKPNAHGARKLDSRAKWEVLGKGSIRQHPYTTCHGVHHLSSDDGEQSRAGLYESKVSLHPSRAQCGGVRHLQARHERILVFHGMHGHFATSPAQTQHGSSCCTCGCNLSFSLHDTLATCDPTVPHQCWTSLHWDLAWLY